MGYFFNRKKQALEFIALNKQYIGDIKNLSKESIDKIISNITTNILLKSMKDVDKGKKKTDDESMH